MKDIRTPLQKEYDKYLKWFLDAKTFEKKDTYYKQLLILKHMILREKQKQK